MIVTCVYIHVKPGETDRFITATTENHQGSVKEPGNLRFDLIQQADDPSKFMLYEAYESDISASDHKKTQHYQKWKTQVEDMMAEPRLGIKYNIIEPSDKTLW